MTSFRITALIAASAFGLAVAMPAFAVDSPSPTPDKPKAETSAPKKKKAPKKKSEQQFIDGYKSLVVGKDISSISLNRVSGSSLTSQGFNSAIQKIKSQAQA